MSLSNAGLDDRGPCKGGLVTGAMSCRWRDANASTPARLMGRPEHAWEFFPHTQTRPRFTSVTTEGRRNTFARSQGRRGVELPCTQPPGLRGYFSHITSLVPPIRSSTTACPAGEGRRRAGDFRAKQKKPPRERGGQDFLTKGLMKRSLRTPFMGRNRTGIRQILHRRQFID